MLSGGLLPRSEQVRAAANQGPRFHPLGGAKDEALSHFVPCAFPTPWWMSRHREQELAIILLDPGAVCASRGARFCRGASSSATISIEDILSTGGYWGLRRASSPDGGGA